MIEKELNHRLGGNGLLHEDVGEFGPAREGADLFDLANILRELRLRGGAYVVVGRGVLGVKRRVQSQCFRDGLSVAQLRVLGANLIGGGIDLGLSAYPCPTRLGGSAGAEMPGFRRQVLRCVLRDLAEVRADLGWHVAHN